MEWKQGNINLMETKTLIKETEDQINRKYNINEKEIIQEIN